MKVELSALADQDLLEIANYLAVDDPVAARTLLKRLDDRLVQLARFSELGRSRPDIGDDLRGLLVSPYVAVYRIDKSTPVVLRILHSSRDMRVVTLLP